MESRTSWSLLKRAIKGTYVNVEPFHLFRYLDEETFRYNTRKADDGVRFPSCCWEHRWQAAHLRTAYRGVYEASVSAEGARMGKATKPKKPKAETPFQRFQKLARGLIGVPKDKQPRPDSR